MNAQCVPGLPFPLEDWERGYPYPRLLLSVTLFLIEVMYFNEAIKKRGVGKEVDPLLKESLCILMALSHDIEADC